MNETTVTHALDVAYLGVVATFDVTPETTTEELVEMARHHWHIAESVDRLMLVHDDGYAVRTHWDGVGGIQVPADVLATVASHDAGRVDQTVLILRPKAIR